MPGMKRDCGGAAGILGAFNLAVRNGFSANLHAVFCLAENAVSDRSTRPDDIHKLYSGLTVEINNTDAEGTLAVSNGKQRYQRLFFCRTACRCGWSFLCKEGFESQRNCGYVHLDNR